MPGVLSGFLEFAQDVLCSAADDSIDRRAFVGQSGQDLGHPTRRRSGVREGFNERAEAQSGTVQLRNLGS